MGDATTPPPSDAALDVAAVAAEARALLAPMRDRRECGSCGMVDPPTEEGGRFHIACPKAHPTMGTYAVETMHSLPTRDTLEPFCHAVIALAARVTAAEAQRAALAGAVREERRASDDYDAACAASDERPAAASRSLERATCADLAAKRTATDALLRGAPGGFVRASVVRRHIGDVLAANGCDCECGHGSDEHDDDCERCLACRVESAVVAALAAAGST